MYFRVFMQCLVLLYSRNPFLFRNACFQIYTLDGFMYNVSGKDVPRQFLRRCVASKLSIPEKANWIEYPGT